MWLKHGLVHTKYHSNLLSNTADTPKKPPNMCIVHAYMCVYMYTTQPQGAKDEPYNYTQAGLNMYLHVQTMKTCTSIFTHPCPKLTRRYKTQSNSYMYNHAYLDHTAATPRSTYQVHVYQVNTCIYVFVQQQYIKQQLIAQ